MKRMRLLAASIVAGFLLVGGCVSNPPPPQQPQGSAPTSTGGANTNPSSPVGSSKEISKRADEYTGQMEAMLERMLQLQAQARKDKDIVKLGCVNETLVTAKQLILLGDTASIALTAAVSANDAAEQEHQLDQLKIAKERVSGEKDAAEACLGDEIVFVGSNAVTVAGLGVDDNPTDDTDLASDNNINSSDFTSVEPVVYASPIAPL